MLGDNSLVRCGLKRGRREERENQIEVHSSINEANGWRSRGVLKEKRTADRQRDNWGGYTIARRVNARCQQEERLSTKGRGLVHILALYSQGIT